MPQKSVEAQLTELRAQLGKAKERLAVAKANRERLTKELRSMKITTIEQAREKVESLQAEASKLEKEAGIFLDRAAKLLERFE